MTPLNRHGARLNYPEVTRILVDEEEVRRTVARLAGEINAYYRDLQAELLVVGLLRGSFIFMADLVRQIDPGARVSTLAWQQPTDEGPQGDCFRACVVEVGIWGVKVLLWPDQDLLVHRGV
jgi:hypothetical protein